jgi:CobQ/CobB/MinD/ParA nucleotide binding domain
MQKKLQIIASNKGGNGKSLLTALFYQCYEKRDDVLFIDLDNSTKTSTKQLKNLGENRLKTVSLLNENDVLDRNNLILFLENLAEENQYNEYIADFGSPEAEQLPYLLQNDINFKEFMDAIGIEAHFNIVISSSGYLSSVQYLDNMRKILKDEFQITVWKNITSFKHLPELAEELKVNCKKMGLELRQFGDFSPSSLTSQILENIRNGSFNMGIGSKLRLKKELQDNFKKEIQNN